MIPNVQGDAYLRMILHKLKTTRQYNWQVKQQQLDLGNYILFRADEVARSQEHSKLIVNWEGQFAIKEHAPTP